MIPPTVANPLCPPPRWTWPGCGAPWTTPVPPAPPRQETLVCSPTLHPCPQPPLATALLPPRVVWLAAARHSAPALGPRSTHADVTPTLGWLPTTRHTAPIGQGRLGTPETMTGHEYVCELL